MNYGFLGGSDGEESASNSRDLGSIPASGRFPGEGNGNPFEYSCLENSMDRGAWRATVHGVTKSRTQLNDYYSHFHETDKGSISKMHKQFIQLNSLKKKTNQKPNEKMGRRPKKTFLQRRKDAQYHSLLKKCKSKLQ